MSKGWKARVRRKDEVKRRAKEPSSMFKNCRVMGCNKPARAATEDGLDTRFCRAHADHYARHGSPYHPSFTAAEINPYRRAAVEWLIASRNDRLVASAVQRVIGLYERAGPYVEAFRLRGLSPMERSAAAWARLRHHKIDPIAVLAAWLAIEMKTSREPQAETKTEFKRVQAAKLVHRLASGTHKTWTQGPVGLITLNVYPASRGRVLRYLGEELESAAEFVAPHFLDATKDDVTPSISRRVRAAPRDLSSRRRKRR